MSDAMSRDADRPSAPAPSDNDRPADPARRRLLSAAPLAGAAALAAGRAGADEPDPAPADPRSVGYRVTDHIAAYYRRARG